MKSFAGQELSARVDAEASARQSGERSQVRELDKRLRELSARDDAEASARQSLERRLQDELSATRRMIIVRAAFQSIHNPSRGIDVTAKLQGLLTHPQKGLDIQAEEGEGSGCAGAWRDWGILPQMNLNSWWSIFTMDGALSLKRERRWSLHQ